jgi:carbon storage regulator CsrA
MLALQRRVGEEIVIGDPRHPLGTIRVVEVHGDKVRLSFDFPRDIQINRKELADLKAKQEGGTPGAPPPPANPGAPGTPGAPPSPPPTAPPSAGSTPPPAPPTTSGAA